MCIRKSRMTRAEEAAYIDCLKQMKAAGINVEIPQRYLESPPSLDIFIAGGPATFIFDLRGGSAAFAVWVRLVALRRITLLDFTLKTTWDDQIVPQSFFDEQAPLWWLGNIDFPRNQVLNMRMDGLSLSPGRMIEGWILAVGLKPIPKAFDHGMAVPFTLVLLDQNENEIKKDAELFVDRTWKQKYKYVRQENDLYGRDVSLATSEPVFRQNINRGPVPAPKVDIAY